MNKGDRVIVDGARTGTVLDSCGGPPVDYEEIVTVLFDGPFERTIEKFANAITEASRCWPPRVVRI